MSRLVSFIVLVAIILVIGAVFFQVMAGFVLPLFLAALLVVMFQPLYRWILFKCKDRKRTAAAVTTAAIMLIVLFPLTGIFWLATIEGIAVVREFDAVALQQKLTNLRKQFDLEMPFTEGLQQIKSGLDRLAERMQFERDGTAPPSPETARQLKDTIVSPLLERARRIRRSLPEPVPDDDAGEPPPALPSRESIEPLIGVLEDLEESAPGELPAALAARVTAAQHEFQHFKQILLGGPVRAWLKDLVNPSVEKLGRVRAAVFEVLQGRFVSVAGPTMAFVGDLLIGLAIMILAVYYFLVDGPAMIGTVMRLSPLDDRYETQLLSEFDTISRAVVLATLLSAVVQGILAGIGFKIAGLGSVFLLMLLTMTLAMVPFVGAAAVWFPACVWLYFDGRPVAAVLLAIYGVGIISMADNVIKPLVLHGQTNLHPLLALLSVIGGVQALGPIGILVGPMVVSFLQALLNMLHLELSAMDERSKAEPSG